MLLYAIAVHYPLKGHDRFDLHGIGGPKRPCLEKAQIFKPGLAVHLFLQVFQYREYHTHIAERLYRLDLWCFAGRVWAAGLEKRPYGGLSLLAPCLCRDYLQRLFKLRREGRQHKKTRVMPGI